MKYSKEEFIYILETLIKYKATHIGINEYYINLLNNNHDYDGLKYKNITILNCLFKSFYCVLIIYVGEKDKLTAGYKKYNLWTFEKYLKLRIFI